MLSLPRTVGHAILALSCLESHNEEIWRLAKDVAACTGISLPYLSKIFHALTLAGLVESKRGYRGGFILARAAEEISLRHVAEAIDPGILERRCVLGMAECSNERACPAHEFWTAERERIEEMLDRLTIATVAAFEWSPETLGCRVFFEEPGE